MPSSACTTAIVRRVDQRLAQIAGVRRVEVLDQHERHAAPGVEVTQEAGERLEPPRRRAHADDREVVGRGRGVGLGAGVGVSAGLGVGAGLGRGARRDRRRRVPPVARSRRTGEPRRPRRAAPGFFFFTALSRYHLHTIFPSRVPGHGLTDSFGSAMKCGYSDTGAARRQSSRACPRPDEAPKAGAWTGFSHIAGYR
jgi:hypothetical protein